MFPHDRAGYHVLVDKTLSCYLLLVDKAASDVVVDTGRFTQMGYR